MFSTGECIRLCLANEVVEVQSVTQDLDVQGPNVSLFWEVPSSSDRII